MSKLKFDSTAGNACFIKSTNIRAPCAFNVRVHCKRNAICNRGKAP